MKRQNENTQALVYAYGCIAPIEDQNVIEEVRKCRAFWDALVRADREHNRKETELVQSMVPEYDSVIRHKEEKQKEVDRLIDLRNKARAKTKSKKTEYDQEVKNAIKIRNDLDKEKRMLVNKWRKENRDLNTQLELHRREKNKNLRKNSGLYWGNYNRVLDNFEASRKTCMKKGRRVRFSDQARDDGCLTVQIQKTKSGLGASYQELMNGTFSGLQIGKVPDDVELMPRNKRTKSCKTKLEMRIDAAGNFLKTTVWMHRSVPDNSRIKSAQITWKREGEKIVGRLCLTLVYPTIEIKHPSKLGCGIDIGWRLNQDGSLRVATVQSSGILEFFDLPEAILNAFNQIKRLSSHIDDDLLAAGEFIHDNPNLPEALRKPIERWRPGLGSRHIDASCMHNAVRDMKWNVPHEIKYWYDRYRHLLVWRDNLMAKTIRHRRELYRLFASRIAKKYAVIGLEDIDLSRLARVKKTPDGEENPLWQQARAQRVMACVHELRSEIEHQAKKHGCEIIYATEQTTGRCRDCGEITGQKDRSLLHWKCEHCGSVWDQDVNASGNILASAIGIASANVVKLDATQKSMTYDPICPSKKKRSQM